MSTYGGAVEAWGSFLSTPQGIAKANHQSIRILRWIQDVIFYVENPATAEIPQVQEIIKTYKQEVMAGYPGDLGDTFWGLTCLANFKVSPLCAIEGGELITHVGAFITSEGVKAVEPFVTSIKAIFQNIEYNHFGAENVEPQRLEALSTSEIPTEEVKTAQQWAMQVGDDLLLNQIVYVLSMHACLKALAGGQVLWRFVEGHVLCQAWQTGRAWMGRGREGKGSALPLTPARP